jgi:hypothetical protein
VKFQGVIRRELQELGPYPPTPTVNTPWWEHLHKRFVHEEVFASERMSENRDFLLSLDPDVIYKVSQLWIAFEKRDAEQWLHFLRELKGDDHVGSPELKAAYAAWSKLLEDDSTVTTPRRTRDSGPDSAALVEARLEEYPNLFRLTRYGPEQEPLTLPPEERDARANPLMDWFYSGGGLLLSSEAFVVFRLARRRLTDDSATDGERSRAFSSLRTELKIDVGVRHPDVRGIPMAEVPPDTTRCA